MRRVLIASLLLSGGAVVAEPLAHMQGAWRGSGFARETPSGPKEAVRCRINNAFADGTLVVKGQCVVPGRKIALSGEMKGKSGSDTLTGFWFNPDGLGSTRISGVQRDDLVAFTFSAKDPKTGELVSQNVEWRVEAESLRLRSTDRADPSVLMSDVSFTR
ncbi:hypothetical protein [Planktotalea sp.]|uniref:hypothetical protein n=1 Tax=Planktotalea sp. TaxID=2029877 RepID=UPI00329A6EB8